MPKTEVTTYERICMSPPKKKITIEKKDIIERVGGIFMAASSPYFGIAPFGLGFMTLERRLSLKALISAVSIFLGSLLMWDKLLIVRYAMATVIYLMALFVLEKDVSLNCKTAPIVMSSSLALVDIAIGYIRGYSFIWALNLVYEITGIFLGSYAMEKGKNVIRSKRLFSRNLTGDEKVSLIFIGALLFLSVKNFDFIDGFSLANALAGVLILGAARSLGATQTAALGLVLGMLCGIETDYFLPFMGAFGFCSLCTGVVAKKGKVWAVISLLIADAIVIVYVNGAMRDMLSIYEIIVAAAAFSAVPDKAYDRFGRLFKIKNPDSATIRKIKGSLILRLKAVSTSFSSLGETMSKLSKNEEEELGEDIAVVFDKTAEKVCAKCQRGGLCWGREFNSTYRSFLKLMESIDQSGEVNEEQVNDAFYNKCKNVSSLTGTLNNQLSIYRLNHSWQKRIGESQLAVYQQIAGVSKIINELAREINEDINYDSLMASELKLRIESRGIKVRDINVIKNRDKKIRVEMSIRRTDFKTRGKGVIRTVVSSAIGKDVNIYKIREDGDYVMIMIDESEIFEIEQGYARAGASEESGDNFRCFMPGGGKFVMTLSDGMGTGKRASLESQAIVELLDSFLRAGFDKHTAVRLINSIMVLKSENDSFATLDMCIIDLHTGEVEFIKTGAEPSFIKQGRNVETVRAASLPVGLMPEMEVSTFARKVKEGDTIVMITDGVETKEGGDKWIKGFMESISPTSANDLAQKLLDRAIKESGGKPYDDMTVISLKVRKKSA